MFCSVSTRLTPSWLTLGNWKCLELNWIEYSWIEKQSIWKQNYCLFAMLNWARHREIEQSHILLLSKGTSSSLPVETTSIYPKANWLPLSVLQFQTQTLKYVTPDHKSSVQAAQIFASFLYTPPIKTKYRGKSHCSRLNKWNAMVSRHPKGCMELGDTSHRGKIDPSLSLSSQNNIMQEVSLKSTCADPWCSYFHPK